ncbi:putative ubiquitin carboxyl-terminal hydrolase [Trichostrongylus colubriformis]|uniref:ubiquitinyl hydrolase 1 n=1 Tax=Trichostrongylus colubriformis TaxID=6319 RepID=A0AAN8F7E0_TRICO
MSHRAQPPVFTPVKTPPPAYNSKPVPPLAVTFRETGGGPTMEEQCTIEHIRSFLGSSDFDEDLCLKAIRHPRLRSQKTSNEEEYLQEVVGVYMDELNHAAEKEQQRSQTPRPALGCANRPMQTIEEAAAEMQQQGAVNVAPVSSSGPTATTATPMPALTSAAEREQSDIEKAIAESLITQGPPGNRSYISSLPANPEDMLRKEGVSVGLHNTGNTCWFNVVAQLLFHLPRFRRVVYEYTPKRSDSTAEDSAQTTDITEADLVEKMRYLFASMDLGNRRYIDPSEALNVVSALAARSKSDVILGRQQDASEMMSNLMDWMEKGLALQQTDHVPESDEPVKQSPPPVSGRNVEAMEISPVASVDAAGCTFMDATVSDQPEPAVINVEEMKNVEAHPTVANSPSRQSNLDCIQALFHGYQAERGSNDVANSWHKLEYTSLFPVHVSHGNLHDALEAHQFLNDSGKEPWFETLPAVLIFSLGRYFFNGTKGETEKLNMRFHFPRTIYMDRYMASNYEYVSSIRETRSQLRNQLSNVRAELKGLNEFPIGDHTEKLVSILNAALLFAKGNDAEISLSDKMDESAAVIALPGPVCASKMQSFIEEKPAVTPIVKNSKELSAIVPELENAVKELEEKHQHLCNLETELTKTIDEIYERDDLKQHGYRLHAVAIHQGQASAGHYWAYVRKGNDDSQWEKFNDQRVESAAWSDIEAEAVGGTRTTSAYFLLYVSSAAEPWLFSDDCPTSSFLMNDIREQVESENAALESEIQRYRNTQNEDMKGNAETSENTCDAIEKEFCPLPPPIGNEDEFLGGTPVERALADPENLAIPLPNLCEPLFSEANFDQEKRKLLSLLEFSSKTYPSTVTPESVIDSQSKLMYRNVLKPMFIALVRRAETSGVVDARELYNKVISSFYDETDNVACPERCRPLRCLPDFWYTMGFRAPAKTMRFAIVRALLNAESDGIVRCAREEIDEFTVVPYADQYVVVFQHASHLYDLIKTLWSVVRQVANDMNHANAANLPRLSPKALELNIRMLKMVRAVTHLYERVYAEVGNIQGPNFREHVDYIIPSYIMRGISIIPVLWIFATIVQFLVDRVPPREDIMRLLTESMTTVEIAIHQLAISAQTGYKDAEKVVSHINETLGMIGLVFPATTTPLKREISRRIHGATQTGRHFEAPLQSFVSQATDICYEVEQAACQLSLLGLADPAEADSVYTRLMAVVSDIINNAMQLDDKNGTALPTAF